MASPLSTGKKSVNLASGEVRVSKIRRDPPPKIKEIWSALADERDRQDVVIGILAFTLALFVIMLAFSSYSGFSPREHIVQM